MSILPPLHPSLLPTPDMWRSALPKWALRAKATRQPPLSAEAAPKGPRRPRRPWHHQSWSFLVAGFLLNSNVFTKSPQVAVKIWKSAASFWVFRLDRTGSLLDHLGLRKIHHLLLLLLPWACDWVGGRVTYLFGLSFYQLAVSHTKLQRTMCPVKLPAPDYIHHLCFNLLCFERLGRTWNRWICSKTARRRAGPSTNITQASVAASAASESAPSEPPCFLQGRHAGTPKTRQIQMSSHISKDATRRAHNLHKRKLIPCMDSRFATKTLTYPLLSCKILFFKQKERNLSVQLPKTSRWISTTAVVSINCSPQPQGAGRGREQRFLQHSLVLTSQRICSNKCWWGNARNFWEHMPS